MMIEPTADDIGRGVIYIDPSYAGALAQAGAITGFNHWQVFVLYHGDKYASVTRREDLEWEFPTESEMTGNPPNCL